MGTDHMGRPTGDDAYYTKAAYDRIQDRWSDCLATIDSVSANPARKGEHLDIRIVGPGCSITLMSLDDLRELIGRARGTLSMRQGDL